MEPFDSLAYLITQAVWAELNKRGWFGKHVDEDEIDSAYEVMADAVEAVLINRIGRLPR